MYQVNDALELTPQGTLYYLINDAPRINDALELTLWH